MAMMKGFTLVEALVALAIVSLGLTICYYAMGQSLRGLAAIKQREEATMRALNHIEKLTSDPEQSATSGAYPNVCVGGYSRRCAKRRSRIAHLSTG
jgi:prepilin-type N-terminal cleavage/methylation domain-containing protein